MSSDAEDPEHRRLRQQAEPAGSLAPLGMATDASESGLWRHCIWAERQRIFLFFVVWFVCLVMAFLVIEIFGYKSVYVLAPLGASLIGMLWLETMLAVVEQRRSRRSRE